MKLTIHLLDDNKLIAAPYDATSGLSPSQWRHLTDQLEIWNNSGRVMVCPVECEIIDMRTPQKEQIETIVQESLSAISQGLMRGIAGDL